MRQARIIEVCEAVASFIRTTWTPIAPDAVTRTYGPDIGLTPDDDATLLSGRQVFVFPASYAVPVQVTRAEVEWRYGVTVLVVERFDQDGETAGTPPVAWMDERIEFVENTIFKPLRDQDLTLLGSVIPSLAEGGEVAQVNVVYDLDLFLKHRAFWSQVTLPFEEVNKLWH